MKLLSIVVFLLFTGHAQAFLDFGCEENKTIREYKTLKGQAQALRIEKRDKNIHQMAQEVLTHLNLDSDYKINSADSYIYFGNGITKSSGRNKRIDCEIFAKKSKGEICKIDCQNWANKKIPVQCYKKGTIGKSYLVDSDKIDNYFW
jgi:hypothetical protein